MCHKYKYCWKNRCYQCSTFMNRITKTPTKKPQSKSNHNHSSCFYPIDHWWMIFWWQFVFEYNRLTTHTLTHSDSIWNVSGEEPLDKSYCEMLVRINCLKISSWFTQLSFYTKPFTTLGHAACLCSRSKRHIIIYFIWFIFANIIRTMQNRRNVNILCAFRSNLKWFNNGLRAHITN